MRRAREHEPPQPEPLAYFLTWSTYGTWLPGDERGGKKGTSMISAERAPLAPLSQVFFAQEAFPWSPYRP
jgi:hypothetical protein